MSTVQIRHLTKRYDREIVVRDVDVDIADGEFFVIVGPSGSGKSSVLRMVAGLEPITGGDVFVDGERMNEVETNDRNLAMMFQEPLLYPHMTVRENLAFPLKMAGTGRAEVDRRVRSTAAVLGLLPLLDRHPARLSGGQQQRVSMGRALVRRTDLLLMDEPMSNLDAKLRTELRSVIGHLQQQIGVTTLYVTHDQIEAMSLGHRIAVMRDGAIVQCGTPVDLYHRPIDAFVATFIGSPSMNLFIATIHRAHGQLVVDVGDSSLPLDDHWSRRLDDRVGSEVVVGVRPHDLRFAADGLIVDVDHIERSPDRCEIRAAVHAAGVSVVRSGVEKGARPSRILVELDAETNVELELWRPSRLTVDPSAIHLFDPGTGLSLHASHDVAAGRSRQAATRATT